MSTYTRAAIALSALLLPPTSALAATDAELSARIIGAWGQNDACIDGHLAFSPDGTFAVSQSGRTETGVWEIRDGVLSGHTDDGSSRPSMLVAYEDGTLVLRAEDDRLILFRCAAAATPD